MSLGNCGFLRAGQFETHLPTRFGWLVTQEVRSEKTEKREYERLLEIHDNYPKYILTTDAFAGGNYEGIKTMHIADFLLSSEY